MNLTPRDITKYISELPDNIRKAVVEFDWAGEVMDIARNHHIQIDDIERFRQETLKVIVGIEPAETYEDRVMEALGVPRATAARLVEEANERIFGELQRRAFSSNDEDAILSEGEAISGQILRNDEHDPYLEPIDHHDVARHMRDEGIELLDHDEPVMHVPETKVDSLENNPGFPIGVGNDKENEIEGVKAKGSEDYLEPIEAKDLRGVKQHQADTSILKKIGQVNPDQALDGVDPKEPLEETLDQNLDQGVFNSMVVAHENEVTLDA